jgi:hypothetical protein
MPISTGTNIILRSGQDPDALAYFARAGIASGTQTPTAYDNAASFNGTNQFLSVASNSTLQVGGQEFSFSIWFNASNAAVNNVFVSKVGAGPSLEYQMGTLGSNLRILIGNGSTGWIVNPVAGTFVTNTWNHAVFTYNGTNATIYLNGTSVGTGTGSITTSGTNQLQIGNNSPYGEKMAGALSSIGFWKKALTPSEVTDLWNNGAGRTYASLGSGLRTNLISWWALNQNSVTADSHGTNTLTNNGSVTAPNIGPIVTTTENSRQLINNFVKGIKSLGLWNSMVCWPLRSSQNAGGGTTAFSLGGLGRFDGTLVNAPVWGGDGVSGFLQNSSRRIETSVGYNFSTQNSIFACARKTAAGDLRLVGQSNETPLFVGTTEIRYFNGATAGGTATHPGTNVRSTYSHAFGSSTVVGMVNGGAPVTSAYSPNNLAIQFFIGQGGTNGWVGDISFFAYFSQQVATSAHSQLHSLYRQTLGLGLGLP